MTLTSTLPAPEVQVRNGQVVIDVAWDDADRLRCLLRRHGLPGTVNLDPETREARLELWNGADLDAVRAILESWVS